ncbi:9805_t:CDS:1, partial [Ambispora leptoticha]
FSSTNASPHQKRGVSFSHFVPNAVKGLTVDGFVTYTGLANGLTRITGQLNKGFDQSSNPSDYQFKVGDYRFDNSLNYTIKNGGTSAFTTDVPTTDVGSLENKRATINFKNQVIGDAPVNTLD